MIHPIRLILALFRKNILNHVVRHPISFIISFYVVPVALLIILLYLPILITETQSYGASSPAPVKSLADVVTNRLIVVQPPNLGPDVGRVISEFTKTLDPANVVILDSEKKVLGQCSDHKKDSRGCHAAVSFFDSPNSTTTGNHTWHYAVRTDKHSTTNKEYLAHEGKEEDIFMPLQLAINNAITNSSAIPETFMFSITEDTNEGYVRETATSMIGVVFLFAVFGCYFIMIYRLTTWITVDRESGMSRLMDSMGSLWCLPARVLSWIIFIDLMCLPLFIIFGIVYWKVAFPSSDAFPLIGWQILLGLSVNSSATFAASFFSKARVSAIYITAVFLILSLATQLFMARTDEQPIPSVMWVLTTLFPAASHALFTKQMLFWQAANLKANYSNFPPGPPSSTADMRVVTQSQTLLILAGQVIIYTILAVVSEWAFHGISTKRRFFSDEKSLSGDSSVMVQDLKKVFRPGFWARLCRCGRRGSVSAVRNISFEAHTDQILCLAGPNGSGKTTTLHAMAGFIRPTSGRVTISASREQVGICPQQNTLWDDLTVRQHVQLWSWIKSGTDSREQIDGLISSCRLSEKQNSYAKTLSGGQKRRLQLACMFVSGSTLCLVDECTSGLDPLSRRAIWDLLLKYRTGRSIIFTTHFLDEVDVLADQIVVLAAGTVCCQGSPAQLNSTHGSGYKVFIPQGASHTDVSKQAVLHQGKQVFTTPDSGSATQLAKAFAAQGVKDVSIAGPQFQDVFLNVAADATSSPTLDSQGAFDLSPGTSTSLLRQLGILFRKRFRVLPKVWTPYIFAIVLPIAASIALLIVVSSYQPIKCADLRPSLGSAEAQKFFYTTTCSQTGYCSKMVLGPQSAKEQLRGPVQKGFSNLREVNSTLFDEYVIVKDKRQTWLDYIMDHRSTDYYSGIYMGSDNEVPVIAYRPDRNTMTGAPALFNLWSEMSSGIEIKTEFGVLSQMPKQDSFQPLIYSIFFILVQSIYPAAFVVYPAIERASKTRALQVANGVRVGPLIAAHALFDAMFVVLSSAITAAVIGVALRYWTGSPALLWIVLLLYGTAAGLSGQIVSRFTAGPLKSFFSVFAVNMIMFAIVAGAYSAETLASATSARNIAYGLGLFLPIGNVFRVMAVGLNMAGRACLDGQTIPSASMESYSGPIVFLILQIIALATIAVWLEGGLAAPWHREATASQTCDLEMMQRGTPGDDVEAETARVERNTSTDLLRALHVTKSFQSNVALDDVTFGLSTGEVLALIGPNGAGKSTLINIIQAELAADSGSMTLCGEDTQRMSARKFLGVCPQHDALDLLSTRQHLTFYAQIRGVKDVKQNVDYLLKRLDLAPHAKTQAAKLSGGNKRKLSLAIALMGTPAVIALDEPTTAMDAVAKRAFWELIQTVAINRSVLLTTHSMEEADSLANRAAILATKMLAIGTTQDLRSKYGSECHVNVHLTSAPYSSTEEMQAFWTFISSKVPSVELERDMSRGQIRFLVPSNDQADGESSNQQIRIGQLMEECKDELGVAYYSVSAATLEGAFLNIIQANNFEQESPTTEEKKKTLRQRIFKR